MPHKCVKCNAIHPDKADYLLTKGCTKCGGKFFFFVKQEALDALERATEQLSAREAAEIEHDVREILREQGAPSTEPVILDLEAIRVLKPGKYEIDITKLFSNEPIVIKVGTGKYEIDLSPLMRRLRG